jgi:hypothetical protein
MVGPHRSPLSPAAPLRGDGSLSPSPSFPAASGMGRVGAREEERWPSPHATVACWECVPLARILMGGTGVHRCQHRCCEARLAALTFPPAPFLSRAAGEEGGMVGPHRSPLSPAAPLRGDGSLSPSPSFPAASGMGRVGAREEERWPSPHATVACWECVPLARILMGGTGVHRCQHRCCEARLAALTFPPAPFLSRAAGEEGGDGSSSPSPSSPAASGKEKVGAGEKE